MIISHTQQTFRENDKKYSTVKFSSVKHKKNTVMIIRDL